MGQMEDILVELVKEFSRTNEILDKMEREIYQIGGDIEELKEAVEAIRDR